jgi:hypothetical protein
MNKSPAARLGLVGILLCVISLQIKHFYISLIFLSIHSKKHAPTAPMHQLATVARMSIGFVSWCVVGANVVLLVQLHFE